LTEEYLHEHTEFRDLKELAQALYDGKVKFKDIQAVKPVFRLHPPKGGHRMGVKWPYAAGGTLGKVPAEFMEKLLMKML
jgi:large subunit ribosomal protein L30